jgi:hypothetical protein
LNEREAGVEAVDANGSIGTVAAIAKVRNTWLTLIYPIEKIRHCARGAVNLVERGIILAGETVAEEKRTGNAGISY